jgi:hypothetical protein
VRTGYAIVDDWYIEGDIREIATILDDGSQYPVWWPSTYLYVTLVESDGEQQVGRVFAIHATGWLPYTIRFWARITDSDFPHGSTMKVWGDFVGEGIWALEQQGSIVHARFTWNVKVAKLLLRHLSFMLHPIFAANHRWAMRKGEESLRLELARRQARSQAEMERIPLPPGPTWRLRWPWQRSRPTRGTRP